MRGTHFASRKLWYGSANVQGMRWGWNRTLQCIVAFRVDTANIARLDGVMKSLYLD
jgi:hypothetical protein